MTGTTNGERSTTDRVIKRLFPVLAILVVMSRMTGFTTAPWVVIFLIGVVAWLIDLYRTRDIRA